MPKRAAEGSERDAPEIIANRRKAKVAPRFRRTSASPGIVAPAAPSAFAGVQINPPKSGFVFGAISTQTPGHGAPSLTTAAPSTGISLPAAGGFTFPANAPAARPAAARKPQEALLPSTSPAPSPSVVVPAPPMMPVTQVAPRPQGAPFGVGPTAAQGVRLNKLFARWISYQITTNSASILDVGSRDYMAFACELRDRAEFARADIVSATGTAFKHPPTSATPKSGTLSSPTPIASETGSRDHVVADAPPKVVSGPAPVSLPTPAPAPAPVATSTPLFSFSTNTALPAAPSGAHFSFSMPPTSTPATAPLSSADVAASKTSSEVGFKFDSGGFGGVKSGAAAQTLFNGFQVPSGLGATMPAATTGGPMAATEEDGMPKEDPSKLERAPGEEDEEVVAHFRAKLFRFKKDEQAWGDMGVGLLRLMKHITNNARRLVLRNDMGKVLLNTALYEGMQVTKTKNTVRFIANISGDGPTTVMIKVTATEIESLHSNVLELVPSS